MTQRKPDTSGVWVTTTAFWFSWLVALLAGMAAGVVAMTVISMILGRS